MNEITLATKQSYQSLTKNLLKLYKSSPINHIKINSLEKKLSLLIEEYPELNKIIKLADTLNQKNTFKSKKTKCFGFDLDELKPKIEKQLPDKTNNIKPSKMSVNGIIIQDIKFTSIIEPLETEKIQISIRLRKKIIEKLKEQNPKYQVLINGILEAYIFNHNKKRS